MANTAVRFINYIEENPSIEVYEVGEYGEINISSQLSDLENRMLEELKKEVSYVELETNHKELQRVLSEFECLINKRIKKLLTPNYWIREISEKFNYFWKKE